MTSVNIEKASLIAQIEQEISKTKAKFKFDNNQEPIVLDYLIASAVASFGKKLSDKAKNQLSNVYDEKTLENASKRVIKNDEGETVSLFEGSSLMLECQIKKPATSLNEALLRDALESMTKLGEKKIDEIIEASRKKNSPAKTFSVETL